MKLKHLVLGVLFAASVSGCGNSPEEIQRQKTNVDNYEHDSKAYAAKASKEFNSLGYDTIKPTSQFMVSTTRDGSSKEMDFILKKTADTSKVPATYAGAYVEDYTFFYGGRETKGVRLSRLDP